MLAVIEETGKGIQKPFFKVKIDLKMLYKHCLVDEYMKSGLLSDEVGFVVII